MAKEINKAEKTNKSQPNKNTKNIKKQDSKQSKSRVVKIKQEEISKDLQKLETIPVANKQEEEIVVEEEVVEKKKSRKKSKDEKPEIVRYYDTSILEGLSSEIVEQRKNEGLVNIVSDVTGKSIFGIIFSNIFTFFNMLYLTITILFVILSSYENLLFLITIVPNLLIGIYQEIKAKKMIDRLKLMNEPHTTVIRDGQKLEIPVNEVVLDDILYFTIGQQISADAVVLEGFAELNESLLTGEADAIDKNVGDHLLSGSFVESGVVVARADKVGKDNYIEKLSKEAKTYIKPKSELLRTLNWIIKIVSIIILPLAIATYLTSSRGAEPDFLSFITNSPLLNKDGLIKASSSVLAMIPAGLFLLTSVALFVSIIRLAKYKTLVQELYSIETLARVDVLCLDKTGTLTDGTMRVSDSIELKNHTNYTIREIMGSMMNAFQDSNPTSEALIKYYDKNKILKATEIVPFSSKRKYSSVTFEGVGSFVLGAPEFILFDNFDKVEKRVDNLTLDGSRVLVLGHTNSKVKSDELPRNIRPICIIAIQDNIRPDAADTIDYFKQNGVDIKIISGDNPKTVSEIAKRAGVEGADRYISLAGMTDEEVADSIFDYNVFGRVSPQQKKILVKALKEHKKTVAMTGDGVNDILALKEADCSIAMASGSEATRYVAHLVLVDSNFSSMPKVVQEGRRVINNIQRTSTLFLTKTIFSILLAVMYIILGMQKGALNMGYPFTAKNLYMIEFFAIGIPATFLALQPNTEIVKGKFLQNVFRTTLPGALTIVLLHIVLNFIRIIPGFDQLHANKEIFTTVATVVTTFVMFLVLYGVSKPFNLPRKLLYFTMLLGSFIVSLNVIPLAKPGVSYRKNIEQHNVIVKVNDGLWEVSEGGDIFTKTNISAYEMPGFIGDIPEEFVRPVLAIDKSGNWLINGVSTKETYNPGDKLKLEVIDDYWYLNEKKTKAKAAIKPEIEFLGNSSVYDEPILTIDRGYWRINNIVTQVLVANDEVLYFSVNNLGFWEINGVSTQLEAYEPILNPDEFVTPTISIETKDGIRYFKINGVLTDIEAEDGDSIDLKTYGSTWYINGINTYVRAEKVRSNNVNTNYVSPTLEISLRGNLVLNGSETELHLQNNLFVLEILITILLVFIADPLMKFIGLVFKRIRVIANE